MTTRSPFSRMRRICSPTSAPKMKSPVHSESGFVTNDPPDGAIASS